MTAALDWDPKSGKYLRGNSLKIDPHLRNRVCYQSPSGLITGSSSISPPMFTCHKILLSHLKFPPTRSWFDGAGTSGIDHRTPLRAMVAKGLFSFQKETDKKFFFFTKKLFCAPSFSSSLKVLIWYNKGFSFLFVGSAFFFSRGYQTIFFLSF